MKRSILSLYALILLVSLASLAFSTKQNEKYTVDTKQSSITWEGGTFFGSNHNGHIALQSGELLVSGSEIKGGQFVIDMNSIAVTDIKGESANKLVAHLKNEDFFNTEKYPTATLTLKKVEYANESDAAVLAELSACGTVQQLTFLAKTKLDGNIIQATAQDIRVDRTIHGSKYASIKFFDDLGHRIINDIFVINTTIVASK